jgi:hypothetical protein
MSLMNPSCPWLVLAPKMFQICANHFVLVLCRFVQVVEACQFFLVPSRSSSTPLYPSKVLRTKEGAPILYSFVVFCLDSHLNPLRNWERVKCKTKALSNHVALIDIKFLESKVIYQYGVPKFLFVDNGRNGMQNLKRYVKHMALFINIQCLNGQIRFEILINDFSCNFFENSNFEVQMKQIKTWS